MKLYSATVNLGGAITNQVIVSQVTAAEIAVLQRLHGEDAVNGVSEVGSVRNRSDQRERARLAAAYPKGMGADGKQPLEGLAFINSILGVGTPLPHEYVEPEVNDEAEEIALEPEQKEEVELVAPKPVKRTHIPPKKKIDDVAELTA